MVIPENFINVSLVNYEHGTSQSKYRDQRRQLKTYKATKQ